MGDKNEDFKAFRPGKIVDNRWKVVAKLGEGGMGAVYKVEDKKRKNYYAAMKVEDDLTEGGVLKLEVHVLQQLQSTSNTIQLLDSGLRERYSFMVMTLAGNDLMSLKRKAARHFSESTTLRVAIGTLYAIKKIHEVGYVHRDIKPGNFMVGSVGRDSRMIYLIDLGMCRSFVVKDETGKYSIKKARAGEVLFRGTPRYCSMNVHNRKEQGRHDDLWSWLYMMIELNCGLPWNRIMDEEDIRAEKERITPESLLKPCPLEFARIYDYLTTLDFNSRPDYHGLFSECQAGLKRIRASYFDLYDWEKNDPKREYETAVSISEKTLASKRPCNRTQLAKKCYPFVSGKFFKENLIGC